MGLVTLQGLSVLGLRLSRPTVGAWAARLEVDYQNTSEPFGGLLELKDEKSSYRGTALRSGVVSGIARLELVGGRGGLVKPIPAQHFRDTTVRTILTALLRAAGETLDGTSTRSVLERKLPFWSIVNDQANEALSLLASALGASWRALPSGNVWFGLDTFPPVAGELAATLLELDRDDAAGSVLLAPESIELGPGATLEGRRIGRVEHSLSRNESLRTTFWVHP